MKMEGQGREVERKLGLIFKHGLMDIACLMLNVNVNGNNLENLSVLNMERRWMNILLN